MAKKKVDKKAIKKDISEMPNEILKTDPAELHPDQGGDVKDGPGHAFMPGPEKIIVPDSANSIDITFEQLKATRTFANAKKLMPKEWPLEHYNFIQNIMDIAEEAGIPARIAQITVPISGIEKISESEAVAKGLNADDADNTLIRQLIGRIDLGDEFVSDLWSLSIGFMYNKNGIEVCLGTNITFCGNLTLYGEAVHYKNFTRNGIELGEMFVHIESWMKDLEGINEVNTKLLKRMQNVAIDWTDDASKFIGHCLREAVRKNYHKGNPFPLNQGQVSKMASYIIDKEHEFQDSPDKDAIQETLYHLYNSGTFILTHQDKFEERFSSVKEFTEWFEEEWLIPNEPHAILGDDVFGVKE